MPRLRLVISALAAVVLALLLGWQLHREKIVKACLDRGGTWHGSESACKRPLRPILRRDLERS